MAEITLYLVVNLDEQYQPMGMLSLETDQGSVVPVFTTGEAAQRFLMSPALQRLVQEGGGPKGVMVDTAASFEDWLFRLRMLDRSTENTAFLLDTDPAWQALSAQLG